MAPRPQGYGQVSRQVNGQGDLYTQGYYVQQIGGMKYENRFQSHQTWTLQKPAPVYKNKGQAKVNGGGQRHKQQGGKYITQQPQIERKEVKLRFFFAFSQSETADEGATTEETTACFAGSSE
ncbi:MAG: hypothetical protein M1834_003224 [Cirrosporium novae-zelandiae]|nr:MAG: hypothetical protein M1834_003224 [Cirrosporium novae-zelandiae]